MDQSEFNKCEMESCGDLCGDCKVRFYHNYIDKDSHFDRNKDKNQVQNMNVIFVTHKKLHCTACFHVFQKYLLISFFVGNRGLRRSTRWYRRTKMAIPHAM